MTATIPLQEPASFTAGDTVKFRINAPDYLPADGWVLSYAFVQSGDYQTVTGTDNGDGTHLVTISAAASVAFLTGVYFYQGYVELSGERFKVREGRLQVLPNFATATGGVDARSHVLATLEALQQTILGKASKDQLSYTINGTTVSKMAPAELIAWHKHYTVLYNQELAAERLNKGEAAGNMIQVRFNGR